MKDSISFYIFMNIYQLYLNAKFLFHFHTVYQINYFISSSPIATGFLQTMAIRYSGFREGQNGKREAPCHVSLEPKAVKDPLQ